VIAVVLAVVLIVMAIAVRYFLFCRGTSPYRYYTLDASLTPRDTEVSIVPEQCVMVGLETTGLDVDTQAIIEIAALKVQRDADRHTIFSTLITPRHTIPSAMTACTGITQAMLDHQGEPLSEVLAAFVDFVGEARFVFFNAPFDCAFLSKAANRIGRKMDNPISCALDMARRAWPGLRSYPLVAFAQSHGMDTRGQHRTLKECARTLLIYYAAATQLGGVD
jgi:DNA polymerase III epsilon subunit-like protein